MKKIALSGKLGKGKFALVDDEDYRLLAAVPWLMHRQGYARRSNVKYLDGLMHRYVIGAKSGDFVDHLNGDKLDNRRSNLRIASRSQNGANRPPLSSNKSGYKGVSWNRRWNRWHAQIRLGGRSRSIGNFLDPIDAARAYDGAAFDQWGEFAYLNWV